MRFAFPTIEKRNGPLQILIVCTGNICRSPLAAALLRNELVDLPIIVSSAGTHALVGEQMTEQNQRIAVEHGVQDGHSHRAVQVTPEMVKDADLVLALSRDHRKKLVELVPRASRYTYTLREFARLASANFADQAQITEGSQVDRLRDFIEHVAKKRGSLPMLSDPTADDVIDPYGQNDDVYRHSASQLIPAVLQTGQQLRAIARWME